MSGIWAWVCRKGAAPGRPCPECGRLRLKVAALELCRPPCLDCATMQGRMLDALRERDAALAMRPSPEEWFRQASAKRTEDEPGGLVTGHPSLQRMFDKQARRNAMALQAAQFVPQPGAQFGVMGLQGLQGLYAAGHQAGGLSG